MMYIFVFLLLVSSASASHYYGGSMTFTPKGLNPDGSHRVDVRYKEAYSYCSTQHVWFCSGGNCGRNIRSVSAQVDSYSGSSHNWCQMETLRTLSIATDSPFQLRESSCCWIYALYN
ncbi:hypothetical protein GN956_G25812, partial [Arapaima gigas]